MSAVHDEQHDAAVAPQRWPPWHAYHEAAQPERTGAPDVSFVRPGSGDGGRAFIALLRVNVLWASGLYPRALRRRELDVSVACDCDEAPKRRGAFIAGGGGDAESSPSELPPPPGAMRFDGAAYMFFPLRSNACALVLFKRVVPRSTGRAMSAVRRAGNAATLLLTAAAPLRAAARRFTKPRTIAVAVLPLALLREHAARGVDVAQPQTMRLPLYSLPRHHQLASADKLVALFERAMARDGTTLADGDAARTGAPTAFGRFAAMVQRRVSSLLVGTRGDDEHKPAPNITSECQLAGAVCISASVEYLRGTHDGGGYEGPARLVVTPRIKKAKPQLVLASQLANHWVCSHQNVYCVLSDEQRAALAPQERDEHTPRLYCWFGCVVHLCSSVHLRAFAAAAASRPPDASVPGCTPPQVWPSGRRRQQHGGARLWPAP
jgi:hypothetical protein